MAAQPPYTEVFFNWDSDHSQTVSNASTPEPCMATPHYLDTDKSACSAYSMWAKPSEDWTKIQDADERRRVQNRIAQRYYRKRMKRKLEYLEETWRMSLGSLSPPRRPQSRLSDPGYRSRPHHVRAISAPSINNDYSGLQYSRQEFSFPISHTYPASTGNNFTPPNSHFELSTGIQCTSEPVVTNHMFASHPASSNIPSQDRLGFPDPWVHSSAPPAASLAEIAPTQYLPLGESTARYSTSHDTPYGRFTSFSNPTHTYPTQSNLPNENTYWSLSQQPPRLQMQCYDDYHVPEGLH